MRQSQILPVLLDWLEANTPNWTRPPPADPTHLRELAMAGAPTRLLNLYRVIGSDAPGLLPHPTNGAGAPLIPANSLITVRSALSELGFRDDGSFWPFGGPADAPYAWLMSHRGVYALTDFHSLVLRGSLDDILRPHFEKLLRTDS